jgi:choline dehydrogenase-like flavoprotein
MSQKTILLCFLAKIFHQKTQKYDFWLTLYFEASLSYCKPFFRFYMTQAQKHMKDRVIYWPRGRVWGGSSALNAMVYVRGHPFDYDRWEKEGATNWSYKLVAVTPVVGWNCPFQALFTVFQES